jgi:hypothetical protein
VERNRESLHRKKRLWNPFWENAPIGAAAVIDWLASEPRVAAARRSLDLESARLYGTPLPDDTNIVPPGN